MACGETAPVMAGQDRAVMDEAALRLLLDRAGRRRGRRRRGRAPGAPAAVHGAGLRHGRPPPGPPPGAARSRLRSGQERRPVRGDRRRAPGGRRRRSRPGRPGGAEPGHRRADRRGAGRLPGRRWSPGRRWCGGRRPLAPEAVVVVTAGTADLPVAEECQATLRAFGFGAALVADAGVAGSAPAARPRGAAAGGRRRRGGGRHGGRPGQRGRRPVRGAGGGRADQRRATGPAWAG